MAAKILRALLFGALGFLLSAAASGFLLVRSAGIAEQHITLIGRARGRELAVALASMAGESFSGPALVRLSATMSRVTSTSRGRADVFEIEEVALLDRDGKVRAHNDIARVAGKAEPVFQGPKFDAVLNLPERDPVSFEVMESKAPRLPLPDFAEEYRDTLAPIIPELPPVPTKILINTAVFRVDEENASARLHIVARVRSGALYQSGLMWLVVEALAASGSVGLLLFLVALLLPAGVSRETRPKEEVVSEDESETDSSGDVDRRAAEEAQPLSGSDTSGELQSQEEPVPLPEPIVETTAEPLKADTAGPVHATVAATLAAGATATVAGVSAGYVQSGTNGAVQESERPSSGHADDAQRAYDMGRLRTVRVAQEDEIPDAIPLD